MSVHQISRLAAAALLAATVAACGSTKGAGAAGTSEAHGDGYATDQGQLTNGVSGTGTKIQIDAGVDARANGYATDEGQLTNGVK